MTNTLNNTNQLLEYDELDVQRWIIGVAHASHLQWNGRETNVVTYSTEKEKKARKQESKEEREQERKQERKKESTTTTATRLRLPDLLATIT